MSTYVVKAEIGYIERLASKVKDNWSLCNLFDGTRNACEAEVMVTQTIHACVLNHKKLGKAFSFRGDGVFGGAGGELIDNGTAYGMLLERKFFVEEEHDDKVVIVVTQKLIDYLDNYFESKK